MQIPKEEIEQRILSIAQREFANKGFLQTSLRTIAGKAGISTSNIYRYFSSKDDLFISVVKPTLTKIETIFRRMESGWELENSAQWSFEAHLPRLEAAAGFIDANREVLKIVAFRAHGSSLQNYSEQLIERYTRLCLEYAKKSGQYYPGLKTDISEFFFHNIASLWMNIIREILMHNVSRDNAANFLKEFIVIGDHY